MPEFKLPSLGHSVELPVYVIHNSPDYEDYFFIFDFEQFVEASQQGVFARPKLKVWADRRDFAKRRFARQFRESFSREFDAARHALVEQKTRKRWGWFSLGWGIEAIAQNYGNLVAELILRVALSASKKVISVFAMPRVFRSRSDFEKLEASIKDTQDAVDTALADIEIVLHPELYAHAYAGVAPRPTDGLDEEAWPLSEFIRQHLNDAATMARW